MFPPIISLKHGPGIIFLYGLGFDVPAYNLFMAGARYKFLHGLGVYVPPIISLRLWSGIKFFRGLGVDVLAYNFYRAWARHKIS